VKLTETGVREGTSQSMHAVPPANDMERPMGDRGSLLGGGMGEETWGRGGRTLRFMRDVLISIV